jgi:hypothetical protein
MGDQESDRMKQFPDWSKFAISVILGTVAALGWMEMRFVSNVQYTNHAVQNAVDMERLYQVQNKYALQERETAANLGDLKVDVGEIKTDVGWLRAYLDVSQPSPRKNGKRP